MLAALSRTVCCVRHFARQRTARGWPQALKEKYTRAKALGAHASGLKAQLAAAKADLERRRLRSAAADISAGGDGVATGAPDEGEQDALRELERLRGEYTAAFDELRALKGEIEHVQRLLEQSRERIAVRAASLLPPVCLTRVRLRLV